MKSNQMDRFCDILGAVQRSSGSTFLSCEPELVELMRQIDSMVEAKKKEWQSQIVMLKDQLQQKSDESQMNINRIENLDKQVKVLRQQLVNERSNHKNAVTQCDSYIVKLKNEVSEMRLKHERLFKKNEKFQATKATESERLSEKLSVLNGVNAKLNEKIVAMTTDLDSVNDRNKELETLVTKQELEIKRQKDIYSKLEMSTAKEMAMMREDLHVVNEKYRELQEHTENVLKPDVEECGKRIDEFVSKNKQLTNEISSATSMNNKLKQVALLKDNKIKQLESDCKKLQAKIFSPDREKEIENVNNKTSIYETQVSSLEKLLSETNKKLDDKLASAQICETKNERLQMENRYLRSILPIQARADESSKCFYGITELEKENNDLFEQLRCLQVEFASTVDGEQCGFSHETFGSFASHDENNSRLNCSFIEKFLKDESLREKKLALKLNDRIKEFDRKCRQLCESNESC